MRRFCDGMIADMQCMEACGKLHVYLENMANKIPNKRTLFPLFHIRWRGKGVEACSAEFCLFW